MNAIIPAQKRSAAKIYAAAGAVTGWFALVLQLFLIITNRTASLAETIVRYFSFFTILTNILVATSFTLLYFKKEEQDNFLTRPKALTATAVYITIVGLIYNTILRFQWAPEGMQRLVDELLHTIIPLSFIVFWIKFVPKQNMQWAAIFPWLIYPVLYISYTLVRGTSAKWYPYPFVDVMALGYNRVFINSGLVCIVFIFFAIAFVVIAKMMSKRSA